MGLFWQDLGILAAVVLAVAYLVVHFVRRRKGKSRCAGCSLAGVVSRTTMQSYRNRPV